MAIQEQTFNLNQFSYEGAGKVYETLAQNAGNKAATAGQEKNIALNEHRSAANTAARFRDAAGATQSKANNIINAATASIDRAGQNKANVAIRSSIAISNSLSKVGELYLSAKVDADTLEGSIEGLKRKADLDDLIASNAGGVVKEIEKVGRDLQADPDNEYLKNYAKQVLQAYPAARKQKRANDVDTAMVSLKGHVLAMDGIIPYKELKGFADKYDLPVSWANAIVYESNVAIATGLLAKATNPLAAKQVKDTWMAKRKKEFGNNHYVNSKSDDMKGVVTAADKVFDDAYTAIGVQFTAQAKNAYVGMMKNPKAVDGETASYIINTGYTDPVTRQAKLDAWSTAYAQQSIDEHFSKNFLSPNVPMATTMWENISPEAKEQHEQVIGSSLLTSFSHGSWEGFDSTLEANPGHISKFGEAVVRTFNTGNAQQKNIIYTRLLEIKSKTTLASTVSQTLSDGDYAKIIQIGDMANAMTYGAEGMSQGDAWTKASQLYSNNKTGNSVQLNASLPEHKEILRNIAENGALLRNGLSGRYTKVVTSIFSNDFTTGGNVQERVKEYFFSLQNINEDIDIHTQDGNVFEDTSNGTDPFTHSTTGLGDKANQYKAELIERVKLDIFKKEGYMPILDIMEFGSDGTLVLKDSWGTTSRIIPVADYIAGKRALMNAEFVAKGVASKARASKRVVKNKQLMDELAQDPVMQNIGETVDGALDQIVDLFQYAQEQHTKAKGGN